MYLVSVNSFLVDNVHIKPETSSDGVISGKSLQSFIDKHQIFRIKDKLEISSNSSLINHRSVKATFLRDVDATIDYIKSNPSNQNQSPIHTGVFNPTLTIGFNKQNPVATQVNSFNHSSNQVKNEEQANSHLQKILKQIYYNKDQFGIPHDALVIPFFIENRVTNSKTPYLLTNWTPHKNKANFKNINEITSAMFFIVKYLIDEDVQLTVSSPFVHKVVEKTLEVMKRYVRDKKYHKNIELLFTELIKEFVGKELVPEHDKVFTYFYENIDSYLPEFIHEYNKLVEANLTNLADDIMREFVNGLTNLPTTSDTIHVTNLRKFADVIRALGNVTHSKVKGFREKFLGVIVFLFLYYLKYKANFQFRPLANNKKNFLNKVEIKRLNYAMIKSVHMFQRDRVMNDALGKLMNFFLEVNLKALIRWAEDGKTKNTTKREDGWKLLNKFVEDEHEEYFDLKRFAGVGLKLQNANYDEYYLQLANYILDTKNITKLENGFSEVVKLFGTNVSISTTEIQQEIKRYFPTFIREFVQKSIDLMDSSVTNVISQLPNFRADLYAQYVRTANRRQVMLMTDLINELSNVTFSFKTDVIREELVELLDLLFQSVQTNKEDWIRAFDTDKKDAPYLEFTRPPRIENSYTEAHAVSHVLDQTNVKDLLVSNVEEHIFSNLLAKLPRNRAIMRTNSQFPTLMESFLINNKDAILNGLGINVVFDYAFEKFVFSVMSNFRNKTQLERLKSSLSDTAEFNGMALDTVAKTFIFSKETINLIENVYAMIDKLRDEEREVVEFSLKHLSYETIEKMGLLKTNICVIDGDKEEILFLRAENEMIYKRTYQIEQFKKKVKEDVEKQLKLIKGNSTNP
jgi:hypothetical protein